MSQRKTDNKMFEMYSEIRVKCSCGHSVAMPVFIDTKTCSYCGKKIQNNTEAYFKYKMRKEIEKIGGKNEKSITNKNL